MAHKPPCGLRSVTKLHLKRRKIENTLTKTLDSKVGFMRWLGTIPPPSCLLGLLIIFSAHLTLRDAANGLRQSAWNLPKHRILR
jgi:hypothetical protein